MSFCSQRCLVFVTIWAFLPFAFFFMSLPFLLCVAVTSLCLVFTALDLVW